MKLKEKDLKFLKSFLSRLPMFVGKVRKNNIIHFLHGYDCGRYPNSNICDIIADYIEDYYKISRKSLGWPYQIELLRKKRKSTWIKVFKTLIEEIIESTEQRDG